MNKTLGGNMARDDKQPESSKALASLPEVESSTPEFHKLHEPIMERYSDVFGRTELYPPRAPVSEWGNLPWMLRIERSSRHDDRLKFKIRPDCAMKAYNSPGLITSHKYEYVEPAE